MVYKMGFHVDLGAQIGIVESLSAYQQGRREPVHLEGWEVVYEEWG